MLYKLCDVTIHSRGETKANYKPSNIRTFAFLYVN